MKISIGDEIHKIVYIEYNDGIPHTVVTQEYIPEAVNGPYWRNNFWDGFANNGDKDDIRLYHSGSGGECPAPKWIDGYIGQFWREKEFELDGEPENFKELPKPKRLKSWKQSSINPFKIAEITTSHEFCEVCNESSTEICWEHVYEDEDDDYELKYKHDNSIY